MVKGVKKELAFWDNIILDDYNLWFKLKLLNKKFYNVPIILCHHRIDKKVLLIILIIVMLMI